MSFFKRLSNLSLLDDVKSTPESSQQTPDERMYMIPLQEIFGGQTQFAAHRLPVSSSASTSTGGYSPLSPKSFSTTYYTRSTEDELGLIPIVEQTELACKQLESPATLQFSIYLDIQRSVLNIHLLNATNLPPSLNKTYQGVFVSMYLASSKETVFESKLVTKACKVVFNEDFDFPNVTSERSSKDTLIFQIYEGTMISVGKFVGSVVLPLGEVDLFGVITTMKIDETGANLPVRTTSLINCIIDVSALVLERVSSN